jgi:membrane-associated protease RseP (regulator of RpoE activity)
MKMQIIEMFYVLTIITIIHELGHFAVAKYFKFNVKEFSVGSGFPIFEQKFKDLNVVFKLALPFGGHIRVDFEVNKFKQMDDRKLLGIIFTSLAGPFVNVVTAIATFQYYPYFALMSLMSGLLNLLPFDSTDGAIALGGIKEYLKRKKS